jgi:hypothetical protein
MINKKLAEKQQLDDCTIQVIEQLHKDRDALLNIAVSAVNDKGNQRLQTLYSLWLFGEHRLQKEWKFKEDDNYIKFWNFPGCSCPKIDNEDNYPYGRYVYNMDCRVHGKSKEQE